MLRTIAYIIFLCTGIFAFTLIVLFFRDQDSVIKNGENPTEQTAEDEFEVANPTVQLSSLLTRLDDTYNFRTSRERDVFQAFIFQFNVDIKVGGGVRMYVFDEEYSLVRKNLMLLTSFYNFQDSTDFFGKTMYLNDKNGDGQIVRFVTDFHGTTLGFEIVRDEYERLKGLLLQ